MRPVLYVLSFVAVMALAFWAYRENYATQQSLRQIGDLQEEIASLRDALTLQKAEWAYLNRPDRLRELVVLNYDRLGLMPLDPNQFGAASAVAYPAETVPLLGGLPAAGGLPAISGNVDVSAQSGDFP